MKLLHIAQSGAHAKLMVESGEVVLNNKVESRKRAKLRPGDIIRVEGHEVTIRESK